MKYLFSAIFLAGLLLFFISAPSQAQSHAEQLSLHADLRDLLLKEGYQEIPISWRKESKTLVVPVTINSSKPQWFIIDSGAVVSSIDPKIVSAQQLVMSNNSMILNGSDNSHQLTHKVQIPELNLAGFTSYHNDAYVVDHSFMTLNSEPIAGTLGLDFLYGHLAVLDIADHRLYLKNGVGLFNPKAFNTCQTLLETTGYQTFTLQHAATGNQMLMTGVNNAPAVTFIVDSGSPFTMLSLNYAKNLALNISASKQQATGIGGKLMTIFITDAKQLAVNKSIWSLPKIAAINFNYIDANTPLHGILGADWLEQGQAIVDFGGDRIFTKSKA